MEQEMLHPPDFRAPDFTQPTLEKADLMKPGFVLLDPTQSPYGSWPSSGGTDWLATGQPDPVLPDLLALERPGELVYPSEDAHALPGVVNVPEVALSPRPGEPASAATGLDQAAWEYSQFSPNQNVMTRRRRHFALLEPDREFEAGHGYVD